jgi:Ca-activated chloride channel family protein
MVAKIAVTLRKYLGLMIVMFIATAGYGQVDTDALALKEQREAATLLSDASLQIEKKNFAVAEAQYREAIDLNQKSEVGKLNLGNAYYNENLNETAMQRFKQAAQVATDKASKHKAFHNLGNTFMKEKMYTEAVEAYKNALRNNPSDDESRYNLALAKELLEKNPPPPTPDENGDDKDQDQKEDQDKKDQENKDKQDEGDNKDDQGDKKDDKKEGEDEKDKGKPDEPKDKKEGEDEQPQQEQPTPGKLSPQQVKSLLEAMNNEEKKVQDKINAKKEKGVKVKTQKDW